MSLTATSRIAVVRDLALRLTDHLVAGRRADRPHGKRHVHGRRSGSGAGALPEPAHSSAPSSRAHGPPSQRLDGADRRPRHQCHRAQPGLHPGRSALDPARARHRAGLPRVRAAGRIGPGRDAQRPKTPPANICARCARQASRSIILGCTHFPFLLPALHRAVRRIGDADFRPRFVDPSEEAVRVRRAAFCPRGFGAHLRPIAFAASGDPEEFRRYASALLGEPLPPVLPLSCDRLNACRFGYNTAGTISPI